MTEIEFRDIVSNRLSGIMKQRNISQDELSELTNISRVSINKYINNKATPSVFNLGKIAKALGCTMDDLTYIG